MAKRKIDEVSTNNSLIPSIVAIAAMKQALVRERRRLSHKEGYFEHRRDRYDSYVWGDEKKEPQVKTPAKKTEPHNYEDLKKIRDLNNQELILKDRIYLIKIKDLRDQVTTLKARIARKDTTIKNLKRKVEKLKEIVAAPEREKEERINDLVENPEFLEILIE